MNRLRGGLAEIDKADDQVADLLDALAARYEGRIRDAFLRAVEAMRDRLQAQAVRDALLAAVERRDTEEVLRLLELTPGGPLTRLNEPLRAAFLEAGRLTAGMGRGRAEMRFDMLDQRTVDLLRDYGLRLISQVAGDTREGVREILIQQLRDGRNPRAVAAGVGRLVGLTEAQARATMNYRRMLEDLQRDALDRRLRDARFDRTVARAIARQEALPARVIDRLVERYRDRALKHRGETIARTESIRAANLANWAAMRQAIEAGVVPAAAVTRRWVVARDERTCETCKPIPKLNPNGVGMMEPFRTPLGVVQHPPLHPNCRCVVTFRLQAD